MGSPFKTKTTKAEANNGVFVRTKIHKRIPPPFRVATTRRSVVTSSAVEAAPAATTPEKYFLLKEGGGARRTSVGVKGEMRPVLNPPSPERRNGRTKSGGTGSPASSTTSAKENQTPNFTSPRVRLPVAEPSAVALRSRLNELKMSPKKSPRKPSRILNAVALVAPHHRSNRRKLFVPRQLLDHEPERSRPITENSFEELWELNKVMRSREVTPIFRARSHKKLLQNSAIPTRRMKMRNNKNPSSTSTVEEAVRTLKENKLDPSSPLSDIICIDLDTVKHTLAVVGGTVLVEVFLVKCYCHTHKASTVLNQGAHHIGIGALTPSTSFLEVHVEQMEKRNISSLFLAFRAFLPREIITKAGVRSRRRSLTSGLPAKLDRGAMPVELIGAIQIGERDGDELSFKFSPRGTSVVLSDVAHSPVRTQDWMSDEAQLKQMNALNGKGARKDLASSSISIKVTREYAHEESRESAIPRRSLSFPPNLETEIRFVMYDEGAEEWKIMKKVTGCVSPFDSRTFPCVDQLISYLNSSSTLRFSIRDKAGSDCVQIEVSKKSANCLSPLKKKSDGRGAAAAFVKGGVRKRPFGVIPDRDYHHPFHISYLPLQGVSGAMSQRVPQSCPWFNDLEMIQLDDYIDMDDSEKSFALLWKAYKRRNMVVESSLKDLWRVLKGFRLEVVGPELLGDLQKRLGITQMWLLFVCKLASERYLTPKQEKALLTGNFTPDLEVDPKTVRRIKEKEKVAENRNGKKENLNEEEPSKQQRGPGRPKKPVEEENPNGEIRKRPIRPNLGTPAKRVRTAKRSTTPPNGRATTDDSPSKNLRKRD